MGAGWPGRERASGVKVKNPEEITVLAIHYSHIRHSHIRHWHKDTEGTLRDSYHYLSDSECPKCLSGANNSSFQGVNRHKYFSKW